MWASGGVSVLTRAFGSAMTSDGAGGAIALCVADSAQAIVVQRLTSTGQLPWGSLGSVLARFDYGVTYMEFPTIVEDGRGGAVVAWLSGDVNTPVANQAMYVSRIDATGQPLWGAGGRPVETNVSRGPFMESDGNGGVVLAWSAYLTDLGFEYRAQHVDGSGTPKWLASGVRVTGPRLGKPLAVVSDGTGGATLVWTDGRNQTGPDVYAQQVAADGSARWRANGLPVYLSSIGQRTPAVVSDGAGGALSAWLESVDGVYEIRAQRFDHLGLPLGPVRTLSSTDAPPKIGPVAISDGAGGAIVAWHEQRTAPPNRLATFLQRMDANDNLLWTPEGVRVASGYGPFGASWLCADGAGGAFTAFISTMGIVRAQHMDANGMFQWGADGALVSSARQTSRSVGPARPCVARDGQGGLFVAWLDGRAYDSPCIRGCGYMIMAQRLNASGTPQWATDGIVLRSSYQTHGYDGAPEIAPDGSGGAFVAWDTGEGSPSVYGQHMDASGDLGWVADGLLLSQDRTAGHPSLVTIAPGHALLAWSDSRSGTGLDLYVQRLGFPAPDLLSPGGAPLCAVSGDQANPLLVADGAGGAIVTWADTRDDPASDVYAQRVDAAGAPRWDAAGIAVSTGPGAQALPVLTPAPDGGAVLAWQDGRTGFAPVVGLARLGPTGVPLWRGSPTPGGPPQSTRLALSAPRPNPAGPVFTMVFTVPDGGPARLELLDTAGRRVATQDVSAQSGGTHTAQLLATGLKPGLYLVRLVHASGERVAKAVVLP